MMGWLTAAASQLSAGLLVLLLAVRQGQAEALRNPDGSCVIFPPDSTWHADVSGWAVYSESRSVIDTIGSDTSFHADFGGGEERPEDSGKYIYYGIPMNTVDTNPAKGAKFPANGAIVFDDWPEESDQGMYPFPKKAKVEGAWYGCNPEDCYGDRHVLALDNYTCTLYEAYNCRGPATRAGSWTCSNGARFDLSSSKLVQRPVGWTSADAAGLPIWAGLIGVREVFKKKFIDHAIRFTAPKIRHAYQYPATHLITADSNAESCGWMGMRARLRSSFDCNSQLSTPEARVICEALKKTGLILADRGSAWFITGQASPRWERALGEQFDQFLTDIKAIRGRDIEVVVPPEGLCLCDYEHAYDCDKTLCKL